MHIERSQPLGWVSPWTAFCNQNSFAVAVAFCPLTSIVGEKGDGFCASEVHMVGSTVEAPWETCASGDSDVNALFPAQHGITSAPLLLSQIWRQNNRWEKTIFICHWVMQPLKESNVFDFYRVIYISDTWSAVWENLVLWQPWLITDSCLARGSENNWFNLQLALLSLPLKVHNPLSQ